MASTTDTVSRNQSRIGPIFAVIAAVVACVVTLVWWLGIRVGAYNTRVVQQQQVIADVRELLSVLKDAETGQRGFLLTGEEHYLKPYNAALNAVKGRLATIDRESREGLISPQAAQLLDDLITGKLAEMDRTIVLRREQGAQAAVEVVKTDDGLRLMDSIRHEIDTVVHDEEMGLAEARVQRSNATLTRTVLSATLGLVALALLAWAYRAIRNAVRSIELEQEKAVAQKDEAERRRELLAVTLASIGDGVIVTDEPGNITFLNGEAQRLTGWSSADANGHPLEDVFRVVDEQTGQDVPSPVDKVRKVGGVVGLANHTLLISRDGRRTPIDDSAAPVRGPDGIMQGVVLVFRDASRQKAAERALRDSETRYRGLFENITEEVHYWQLVREPDGSLKTWKLVDANAPALATWRRKIEDIRGKTADEIFGPGATDRYRHVVEKILRDGAPYVYEEYFPDQDRHFRFTSILFGEYFITTAIDVSSYRKAQKQLTAAKLAAEEANNAKDRFLAVLSHELRNPLAPVLASASLMQQSPELDAQTRENLEIIRRNVELEARLIDDLLDVTRIAQGKVVLNREKVPVCEVVRRTIEVCKPDIEARGLKFSFEVMADSGCTVDADSGRLQQVFWNLLKNAVKFTPRGGAVGVRVSSKAPIDAQGDAARDRCVTIEFIDSGVGIEQHSLPRLFRPFEQGERGTVRQFGGLGLGLTISKAMVELHGGTIEARSDGRNKGSTFLVRLPLASESGVCQPCRTRGEPPVVAQAATRPLRILLVEDHDDTAKIMKQLLCAQHHSVATAGDLATAMELVGSAHFDLLLSDLGLPDGSGVDLMRRLRAAGKSLPGIALSGYGQEQDIRRSREAGFAVHLTKPVTWTQLSAAIASIAQDQRAAAK